jgi:hypothetical protein
MNPKDFYNPFSSSMLPTKNTSTIKPMTTNETIAKWLELDGIISNDTVTLAYNKERTGSYKLDFLHDRNQQKWIEDELIANDYEIEYGYVAKDDGWWEVGIFDSMPMETINILQRNVSKDTAFIEAVLELIEKENESNSPK